MVPDKTPKPKAAIINDKKGCHFNTEVERMIKTIANINKRINHMIRQDTGKN
jgi:hypothetical protein